jgi:hypothetical protein
MPYLPNFLGVSFNEGGTHGPDPLVPGYLFDQTSGFAASTEVFIELALSTTATMDVVLRTDQLPTDFDIASSRVFFGTYDDTLFCMGLFVSQIGLAFGGAYDDNPYVIPGTASLVQTGQTYAARLVLSPTQEAVYVYWSEMGEAIAAGGPALVAVLPLLSSQDVPSHLEGAYFSVRGSSSRPVRVSLLSWCLASVALMQDLPPVADAGVNQAVARCAAVRLDGSGSYDPEGGALTYLWKLIDGPASSGYIDEGQDGETQASVSGFVTKLYSSHAAGGDAFDVSAGDILLVGGTPYVLVGTGSDIDGDYFEITTETLPESLPSVAFKVVRQSGFLSSNEQKVTFLPDVSGLYRFQLKVSDGSLTSSPSETMADVRAISAPRGVVPNTTFLWDQMSDVSRLLEDGGRIEALWEGVLQCVGAVLLAESVVEPAHRALVLRACGLGELERPVELGDRLLGLRQNAVKVPIFLPRLVEQVDVRRHVSRVALPEDLRDPRRSHRPADALELVPERLVGHHAHAEGTRRGALHHRRDAEGSGHRVDGLGEVCTHSESP